MLVVKIDYIGMESAHTEIPITDYRLQEPSKGLNFAAPRRQ